MTRNRTKPGQLPVLLVEHRRRDSGHWETVWRDTHGNRIRLVVPADQFSEQTLERLRRWLERK